MRVRVALGACFVMLAGPGCGGLYYASTINSASARFAEAREMGAERKAPYEYTYAQAHLEQAQVEASHASYSDAAAFAEIAEQYALKAIEASRSSTSTADRP